MGGESLPNISASPSSTLLTTKQIEDNTRNVKEYLELLRNEVRRLRIGDTSAGDENVL